MKDSYVEQRFPRYFEHGEHTDGRVDVVSLSDDGIATVTRQQAAKLIEQRNTGIDMMCALARKLDEIAPDEFDRLWYGDKKN